MNNLTQLKAVIELIKTYEKNYNHLPAFSNDKFWLRWVEEGCLFGLEFSYQAISMTTDLYTIALGTSRPRLAMNTSQWDVTGQSVRTRFETR